MPFPGQIRIINGKKVGVPYAENQYTKYRKKGVKCVLPRLNASLASSLCVLEPTALMNGDLDERIAAMLTALSKHLKNAPYIMSFPRKTSNGNFASCLPSGVRVSVFVSALTSLRASMARRIFLDDGGSMASESVGSTSPKLHIFTRRTRSCNESRSISGVCCSASCW